MAQALLYLFRSLEQPVFLRRITRRPGILFIFAWAMTPAAVLANGQTALSILNSGRACVRLPRVALTEGLSVPLEHATIMVMPAGVNRPDIMAWSAECAAATSGLPVVAVQPASQAELLEIVACKSVTIPPPPEPSAEVIRGAVEPAQRALADERLQGQYGLIDHGATDPALWAVWQDPGLQALADAVHTGAIDLGIPAHAKALEAADRSLPEMVRAIDQGGSLLPGALAGGRNVVGPPVRMPGAGLSAEFTVPLRSGVMDPMRLYLRRPPEGIEEAAQLTLLGELPRGTHGSGAVVAVTAIEATGDVYKVSYQLGEGLETATMTVKALKYQSYRPAVQATPASREPVFLAWHKEPTNRMNGEVVIIRDNAVTASAYETLYFEAPPEGAYGVTTGVLVANPSSTDGLVTVWGIERVDGGFWLGIGKGGRIEPLFVKDLRYRPAAEPPAKVARPKSD